MANILIAYSTTDGHTKRICERLGQVIEEQAHKVTLAFINDEPDIELDPFDIIVIGASIRYGKHRPQVYQFIRKNRLVLDSKPNAFFSVNIVARKPEKNEPETNPYLKNFSGKHPGIQGYQRFLPENLTIRYTHSGIVRSSDSSCG